METFWDFIVTDVIGFEDSNPLPFALLVICIRVFLVASQVELTRYLRRKNRVMGTVVGVAGLSLMLASGIFSYDAILFDIPRVPYWWRPLSACWTAGSFGAYSLIWVYRLANRWKGRPSGAPPAATEPLTGRRELLRPVAAVALAAPFAVAGYGSYICRKQFNVEEHDIVLPNLPDDLDGFRIVQLTDIHCGPFFSTKDVDHIVGLANDARADLAVVTGDLVTTDDDPLDACIDRLAHLRADLGVVGCLGNHEIYAKAEAHTAIRAGRRGIRVLRSATETLRVGRAELALTGVDYQRRSRAYLEGVEAEAATERVNILLSHNPDVFLKAEELGYDFTISGHTHGGQVTVEIADQFLNPGRFFTPFVSGEYRHKDSALYVSRGVGTVNLPIRLGAPPEIPIFRLKKS